MADANPPAAAASHSFLSQPPSEVCWQDREGGEGSDRLRERREHTAQPERYAAPR